jgi:hypothetical protein
MKKTADLTAISKIYTVFQGVACITRDVWLQFDASMQTILTKENVYIYRQMAKGENASGYHWGGMKCL